MNTSIKINYRKKDYFRDNLQINYFALSLNEQILLFRKTLNTSSNEVISSHYHNFINKNEYSNSLKELDSNKNKYMISKNEYDRLIKIYQKEFKYKF
ncbi:MAG: hypothetical protein IJ086_10295 [Clostridium sp.]|nr:hypothetical protein [Clostridium sp.]